MADKTNPQITDAVTQANVKVLGDAPAQALSTLYQSMSQSIALSVGNGVTAQQQTNVMHQAATTMGVTTLHGLSTAATGNAARSAAGGKKKPAAAG